MDIKEEEEDNYLMEDEMMEEKAEIEHKDLEKGEKHPGDTIQMEIDQEEERTKISMKMMECFEIEYNNVDNVEDVKVK